MINTFTSSVIRTNTDILHLLSPTNVPSALQYPDIFTVQTNPLAATTTTAGVSIGVSTYLKIIPVKSSSVEPNMLVVGWNEISAANETRYIPFTLWEGVLNNGATDGDNPLVATGTIFYSVALPISSENTPAKIISCGSAEFAGETIKGIPGGILLDALGAKFITFYFQSSNSVLCNALYGSI
jgi:hypothetical protein